MSQILDYSLKILKWSEIIFLSKTIALAKTFQNFHTNNNNKHILLLLSFSKQNQKYCLTKYKIVRLS